MSPPPDRRYSTAHLWVESIGDRCRIGVTHHAQETLGELEFVDLPEAGAWLAAGEPFGALESGKAISDLIAPLAGVVVASNGALAETPGTVNAAPYHEGWLIELEPADPDALADLLDATAYAALTV